MYYRIIIRSANRRTRPSCCIEVGTPRHASVLIELLLPARHCSFEICDFNMRDRVRVVYIILIILLYIMCFTFAPESTGGYVWRYDVHANATTVAVVRSPFLFIIIYLFFFPAPYHSLTLSFSSD